MKNIELKEVLFKEFFPENHIICLQTYEEKFKLLTENYKQYSKDFHKAHPGEEALVIKQILEQKNVAIIHYDNKKVEFRYHQGKTSLTLQSLTVASFSGLLEEIKKNKDFYVFSSFTEMHLPFESINGKEYTGHTIENIKDHACLFKWKKYSFDLSL